MTKATDTGSAGDEVADDVRPVVDLPRAGLSSMAIVLICAGAAIILFLVLDSGRRARDAASQRSVVLDGAIASPPPLQLPPEPPPSTAPAGPVTMKTEPIRPIISVPMGSPLGNPLMPPPTSYFGPPPPAPTPSAKSPEQVAATADGDPVLIIDTGAKQEAAAGGVKAGVSDALAADESGVKATRIRNKATLVPQGTIIDAVLETPINSARPGLVRAVVSRDARGFDGTRVLIPRGSRLIGEAQGDIKPGQKRVLVQWSRLIRPDGVAMRIGSPASDTLGQAGVTGRVNSHFWARFANAALQSAMSAGVAYAGRSSGGAYIYGLPNLSGAGQSLFPDGAPGATIKVPAAAEIAVFVARDLDFSGTGQ